MRGPSGTGCGGVLGPERETVESVQQRVAVATTAELLSRRAELAAILARWRRGAYGQQLDGLAEFEVDAIMAELRSRYAAGRIR